MTTEEKFDKIVGTGSQAIKAGSYKPEGSEDTHYRFLINFDFPVFPEDMEKTFSMIGKKRVLSVKAAGIFNKANNYGTLEEAEEFAAAANSVEGWQNYFLAKAKRETGERVSGITPLVQCARDILELGLISARGLDAATVDKAALKEIRAEVRLNQKDNSARWQWATGKAVKELEARMKKTADMPE